MRVLDWLAPGVSALSLLPAAQAAPSPGSIGSDLTILAYNDLYGNLSTHDAAVIVLSTPQTLEEARSNCAALGEQLWAPPANSSKTVSALSLGYLGFADPSGKGAQYWIDETASHKARAVNHAGLVSVRSRQTKLPALCTQSAPLSTASDVDTSPQWQTTVKSGNQQVTGYRDKLSFRFEGLRYALEPERFAYSTLYEGTGNASALSPGAQCVQSGCTGSTCSEDCLFLNLWSPYLPKDSSSPAHKLKPVMFWIHGGAFTGGTGSDPTFDGGNMASRGDVVVVTINYRLSTLGFLALDDGELNGNYGLADQIIALDWVHAHIKDFGGDPDRITIFGQSAGAASVRALLASPKAIGKYQAAISQSNLGGSNYATTYSQYYTIEQEVAIAANPILNETGCADASDQVECLRSFDAFELVGLSDVARYLVVDGTYLTTPFLTLTGTGPAAHVPILTGVMRDDAAAFISYPQANDTLNTFLTTSGFPSTPNITDLFPIPYSLYPTNTTLAIFNATARLATDAELRCLTHATAYSALKHSVFPRIFAYEFSRSYQPPGYSPNAPVCEAPRTSTYPAGDPTQEYFKCHSGELYYVFGNLVRSGLPLRDEGDVPFAQHVLDAWTAFARTGDPNPDAAWLRARGCGERAGDRWREVSVEAPAFRNLEWPVSEERAFGEAEQCQVLGFPLDYYE